MLLLICRYFVYSNYHFTIIIYIIMKRFHIFPVLSALLVFFVSATPTFASTIFNDNFTDTNGTTLESHGPYTLFDGSSATIQSNSLVFPDLQVGRYYYNNATGTDDYSTCFTKNEWFSQNG